MEHRNKACQDFSTASAFPAKAAPSRSIPPAFQTGQPLPAAPGLPRGSKRRAALRVPPASLARYPRKTALCTKSVPPCGVPAAIIKGLPRRIRLFIAGRPLPILPEVFQRPGSKHEREKEKTPASSLPSFPPSFSRSHDQTCPFLPAASQRRGPAARPEESFFGDGESTRGEGAVFTKNAPSPLVIPLLQGLSPTKKAGQSPAPAFTGKTKER